MNLRVLVLFVALTVSTAFALPPCEVTGCRTQTQGGWGNDCNGNNPGCFRDANFAATFPAGLTVGGTFTIHFASSNAVRIFLPAGGTPDVLTQNHVDPASTEAGVFAGQVTALALTLGFSDAGLEGFCDLGALFYLSIVPTGEPFVGMTVNELFALANEVLGGDLSGLPGGTDVSDLNEVIKTINENFDNGTIDNGNLTCDIILGAELISFSGVARDGAVELFWTTASESDVERFEIERASSENWSVSGAVNGMGDSPVGHNYRFVDRNITSGVTYRYRLVEVSFDGSRNVYAQVVTVEADLESTMPTEFALLQNYPNPFNPNTLISFSIPVASSVSVTVFDALGRNVATLVNSTLSAGNHSVSFDASTLSNGIYFYQLRAGDFSAVRKMVLMK